MTEISLIIVASVVNIGLLITIITILEMRKKQELQYIAEYKEKISQKHRHLLEKK